jgi:hypothetical protein
MSGVHLGDSVQRLSTWYYRSCIVHTVTDTYFLERRKEYNRYIGL